MLRSSGVDGCSPGGSSAGDPGRLGPGRLAALSLPWLLMSFIMMPLGMFIPAFYAGHTTATLAGIGVATGAARIVDAFVDPLIGHLSDRTRSRFGPRKPWIAFGALLFVACVWYLFQPPRSAGVGYYLVWSGGLYFAYACVEIPMRAWSSELSRDNVERARIFTAIGVCMALGSLVFWASPYLARAMGGTSDLNDPRVMALVAWIFAVVFPVLVGGAIATIPPAPEESVERHSLGELARSMGRNRPFWIYVAGLSVWSVGNAASASLVFIFLSDYLRLGAAVTPLMITYFVVQLIAMPLWVRLVARFDKHRLLAACWLLDAALKPLLLLFEPGSVNIIVAYAVLIPGAVLGSISYTFPQAVLADVVDFDTLKTRTNKAASYFALNTLLYKVMMGLGAAIALSTLGAFGYVIGQAHDAEARLGMLVGVMVFPAICLASAAWIMWRFPIDSRRRAVITVRLNERRRRAERQASAQS